MNKQIDIKRHVIVRIDEDLKISEYHRVFIAFSFCCDNVRISRLLSGPHAVDLFEATHF